MIQSKYRKLLGRLREKGLTQAQLSDELGLNPATISAKLNCHSDFSAREISEICRVLDIQPEDIGSFFFAQSAKKT